MARILCIDTATAVCSAALSDNGTVIAVKETEEEKAHASRLTVLINDLFRESDIRAEDLDAVAVSKGPGSYTGLRIGVSTAKGICYGSDLPLIGINTLVCMANGFVHQNHRGNTGELFCPMIDARRMEVYTAIFNEKGEEIFGTAALIVNEETFSDLLKASKIYFFGSGADKCKSVLKHENARFPENFSHSSAYMAALAEEAFSTSRFEDVAYFEPFYLKDFITTVPKRKWIS